MLYERNSVPYLKSKIDIQNGEVKCFLKRLQIASW